MARYSWVVLSNAPVVVFSLKEQLPKLASWVFYVLCRLARVVYQELRVCCFFGERFLELAILVVNCHNNMLRLVVVRFAQIFSSSFNHIGSFLFLYSSLVLIDLMLLRARIFFRNWLSLICRGDRIASKDLGNYFQEVTIHGFFKENNFFLPNSFFIGEVVTKWFDFTDCIKGFLGLLVSVFYVLRKLHSCELVMNHFQSVRDYVILLRQGSEGC